jgi:hypothetical protein
MEMMQGGVTVFALDRPAVEYQLKEFACQVSVCQKVTNKTTRMNERIAYQMNS